MKKSIILSFILFIPFIVSAQCDKLENHPDGKDAALRLFVYRDSFEKTIGIDSVPFDNIDKGNRALREGKIKKAKEYFAEAVDDFYIPLNERFKATIRLAKLHQQDKEWEQALKFFNKAKELNPDSGEPYISKGMLYLSANKNCSEFERKLVVSAALDEFEKALQYEDEKQDAQDKIKRYREYLPTREELFQRGITVGSERIVGCVLKVKTKIRAKD